MLRVLSSWTRSRTTFSRCPDIKTTLSSWIFIRTSTWLAFADEPPSRICFSDALLYEDKITGCLHYKPISQNNRVFQKFPRLQKAPRSKEDSNTAPCFLGIHDSRILSEAIQPPLTDFSPSGPDLHQHRCSQEFAVYTHSVFSSFIKNYIVLVPCE